MKRDGRRPTRNWPPVSFFVDASSDAPPQGAALTPLRRNEPRRPRTGRGVRSVNPSVRVPERRTVAARRPALLVVVVVVRVAAEIGAAATEAFGLYGETAVHLA